MDQHITTPITEEVTKKLHSGDYVYITGTIYVARDAAHKRMIEALDRGDQLPIDIKDATIYYMGPSPAREGRPIGSAGPTTATRMDKYAPTLLDLGEKAMIGKGKRSKEVIDAIIRNHAVYFARGGQERQGPSPCPYSRQRRHRPDRPSKDAHSPPAHCRDARLRGGCPYGP